MNKKFKMKLFGFLLVFFGSIIIVYSVASSTSVGFFSIYTGVLMLISGLSILGFNVGSYGFG